MSHAIRLPDQLRQHLRALRKSHGLTQARLGALVGVKQARIAEIEADPGAVSLDQLARILAALGGTLHLHTAGASGPAPTRTALPAPEAHPRAPTESAKQDPARRPTVSSSNRNRPAAAVPVGRRKVATLAQPAPQTHVVIRAKRGAW